MGGSPNPLPSASVSEDEREKPKSISKPALCIQEGVKTKTPRSGVSDIVRKIALRLAILKGDWSIVESISKPALCIQEGVKTKTPRSRVSDLKRKSDLRQAILKGDWSIVESILKEDEHLATRAIRTDGSTILHIAVEMGHNNIVKKSFSYINDEQVLQKRRSDGSTALHIAAIVGNRRAAELLSRKNNKLLRRKDHKGEEPIKKAYEHMHLDIVEYLLKASYYDVKTKLQSSRAGFVHPSLGFASDLLLNAISAKKYGLASELVRKFPKFASESDNVLMAIAKNFPSGLDPGETLINLLPFSFMLILMPLIGAIMDTSVFVFICFLTLIVCFAFLADFLLRGHAKKKDCNEAKKVLELVCDEIDKLDYCGTHHSYYTRPILEAACQNAYEVVDEILFRSPKAIESRDQSGYDIIQLAVIHRSEKIYNLIYDIGKRKNLYGIMVDSCGNNMLHLAGKLAPSRILNQTAGAALQMQRELQWFEEVKTLIPPEYRAKENKNKETPSMVFKREHQNLVREGEWWINNTAQSFMTIAALIATLAFSAAYTLPDALQDARNQEMRTTFFKKKLAFFIFVISDAISLFASATAILVFLSIRASRFAENDFIVSLPSRLFIGLFFLLLSTAAMMVAFSTTVFHVFCDEKEWMIAPICVLAFIPFAFFVRLQLPLMVNLFTSTYSSMFGKQRNSLLKRFKPDEMELHFGI